jgi:hypothetical protein
MGATSGGETTRSPRKQTKMKYHAVGTIPKILSKNRKKAKQIDTCADMLEQTLQ